MSGNKDIYIDRSSKPAEFAIIGSFNFWNRENLLKFYIVNFLLNIKFYIYSFINKEKLSKIKKRKEVLKLTHGCKIYGHEALLLSLLRGLNNLKVKYTYNKITKHTKNVILLWADKKDLNIIEKYKRTQKLKVVTVPTACKFDYDYMQWQFPHENAVDVALYAAQWVADICIQKAKKQNLHKIKVWPSGVLLATPALLHKKPTNSCIVYFKRLPVNEELLRMLDELAIHYHIMNYGKYNFDIWKETLKTCDFAIFYQDYHETQGLALAEAWANNVPTFVKTKVKNSLEGTAPYLCAENGEYFVDLDELKKILLDYKKDPEKFLSKFSPYKYVVENMSDTKTVENLLQLFEEIKKE